MSTFKQSPKDYTGRTLAGLDVGTRASGLVNILGLLDSRSNCIDDYTRCSGQPLPRVSSKGWPLCCWAVSTTLR